MSYIEIRGLYLLYVELLSCNFLSEWTWVVPAFGIAMDVPSPSIDRDRTYP